MLVFVTLNSDKPKHFGLKFFHQLTVERIFFYVYAKNIASFMKVNLRKKMFLYYFVHKYGNCLTGELWEGLCFPCENSPEFCQLYNP